MVCEMIRNRLTAIVVVLWVLLVALAIFQSRLVSKGGAVYFGLPYLLSAAVTLLAIVFVYICCCPEASVRLFRTGLFVVPLLLMHWMLMCLDIFRDGLSGTGKWGGMAVWVLAVYVCAWLLINGLVAMRAMSLCTGPARFFAAGLMVLSLQYHWLA